MPKIDIFLLMDHRGNIGIYRSIQVINPISFIPLKYNKVRLHTFNFPCFPLWLYLMFYNFKSLFTSLTQLLSHYMVISHVNYATIHLLIINKPLLVRSHVKVQSKNQVPSLLLEENVTRYRTYKYM